MLEAAGGVFWTHESCRIGTEVGAMGEHRVVAHGGSDCSPTGVRRLPGAFFSHTISRQWGRAGDEWPDHFIRRES